MPHAPLEPRAERPSAHWAPPSQPDAPAARARRQVLHRLGAGLAWATGLATTHATSAPLCESGRRQSPVDITAPQASAGPALSWEGYRSAPLRCVHDGHTVRVRFPASGPQRSQLWRGAERLTLTQFHIHQPGGDRLRGEDFPMALHLPHHSPSGQLVTVVAWFRLGAAHAGLAALLPLLPRAGEPERQPSGHTVNPADFVPAERGYFAYEGSLTGPPCTEGVAWLVLQQAQTLSASQLAQVQALVAPNARAVQPMNGRVVRQIG